MLSSSLMGGTFAPFWSKLVMAQKNERYKDTFKASVKNMSLSLKIGWTLLLISAWLRHTLVDAGFTAVKNWSFTQATHLALRHISYISPNTSLQGLNQHQNSCTGSTVDRQDTEACNIQIKVKILMPTVINAWYSLPFCDRHFCSQICPVSNLWTHFEPECGPFQQWWTNSTSFCLWNASKPTCILCHEPVFICLLYLNISGAYYTLFITLLYQLIFWS